MSENLSDRGLDVYRSPTSAGLRLCRNCTVVTYEIDAGSIAKSFNVAARVAADARDLLAAVVTKDIARIDALIKARKEDAITNRQMKEEEAATSKYRQMLEGRKIDSWIKEMGCFFTDECKRIALKDGYECPAQYFVANAEMCGKDPFDQELCMREVRSWTGMDLIAESCPLDAEGYYDRPCDRIHNSFFGTDSLQLKPAPNTIPIDTVDVSLSSSSAYQKDALDSEIVDFIHDWVASKDVEAAKMMDLFTELECKFSDIDSMDHLIRECAATAVTTKHAAAPKKKKRSKSRFQKCVGNREDELFGPDD